MSRMFFTGPKSAMSDHTEGLEPAAIHIEMPTYNHNTNKAHAVVPKNSIEVQLGNATLQCG